jgi:hypothetical protein
MTDVLQLAQRVNTALGRLGSSQSVAEFHGALVGLLCAKGSVDKDDWLVQVAPGDGADLLLVEVRESLSQLHGETLRQLNDPVLDFEPLLPSEDEPLDERVEALGEWCLGFLLGLSEGGVRDPERLPADAAEVVRDLVDISRAGAYEFSDSDQDEQAYAELLEYVRAGVLLLNEELNPTRAAPRSDGNLH